MKKTMDLNFKKASDGLPSIPFEESLLSHVTKKDKKKADDWERRASQGEIMRIM